MRRRSFGKEISFMKDLQYRFAPFPLTHSNNVVAKLTDLPLLPESVQVNIILFWIQDLASELQRQAKPAEAATYLRKALKYMSDEKGEQMALVRGCADLL